MSETLDPQPTNQNQDEPRFVPGKPLPRLWKTEPDSDDEDGKEATTGPGKSKKKSVAEGDKESEASASVSQSSSKSRKAASKPSRSKSKKKPADDPDGEKRVLIEETPAFDTIETRQRARMVIGGLMIFCVMIFGWIVYGMIFADSGPQVEAVELTYDAMPSVPSGPAAREPEALYMLDRARDYAKRGQVPAAIVMLKRIVSAYRGTTAAAEAQAALNRPKQNLPLFPERPFLLANQAPDAKSSPPPPAAAGPAGATAPSSNRTAPVPPHLAMARSNTGAGAGASPAPANHPPATSPRPPAHPVHTTSPTPTAPGNNNATMAGPASVHAPGTIPGTNTVPPPSGQTSAMPPGQATGLSTTAPGTGSPSNATPPGSGNATLVLPGSAGNPGNAPAPNTNATSTSTTETTPALPERKLPPGFRARPEHGYHESRWPHVIVGERDGGNMVLVPGGTFMMGSDRGDASNRPQHAVQLSTYYIDQHEITNKQFRIFLEETKYHGLPPGKWLTDPKMRSAPEDLPAVNVSYQDIEQYALWALKRLPTEAQWEMAARSIDNRRSPWGNEPPRWSRPRKLGQIDPVMSFPEDVSPYRVFDMAGNAVEWVRDWYDPACYKRMGDTTPLDPTGPRGKRQGIKRVIKGASKDWLMYTRQGMDSDRRLPYLGFRCSVAVEGGEASALITPRTVKPKSEQPGNQGDSEFVPF